MSFNWQDWQFTRDADPPITSYPWWMDRRHVEFIYELLMTGRFRNVLEIGCHHGSSTAALVQAANDSAGFNLHLAEPVYSQQLEQVVKVCTRRPVLHHTCSLRVIPQRYWDLVIVDGDHSLTQVSREFGLLLFHEVPNIIVHDVEAFRLGVESCEGATYLGDALKHHPAFTTMVDSETRPNEYTQRGFMFATKHRDTKTAALSSWEKMLRH